MDGERQNDAERARPHLWKFNRVLVIIVVFGCGILALYIGQRLRAIHPSVNNVSNVAEEFTDYSISGAYTGSVDADPNDWLIIKQTGSSTILVSGFAVWRGVNEDTHTGELNNATGTIISNDAAYVRLASKFDTSPNAGDCLLLLYFSQANANLGTSKSVSVAQEGEDKCPFGFNVSFSGYYVATSSEDFLSSFQSDTISP